VVNHGGKYYLIIESKHETSFHLKVKGTSATSLLGHISLYNNCYDNLPPVVVTDYKTADLLIWHFADAI
jgi:hypothetical protein